MNDENDLVVDLWDRVKDYIPVAKREDAAIQVLTSFINHDYDLNLKALEGNDDHLDNAIEVLSEEDEEEVEEDY